MREKTARTIRTISMLLTLIALSLTTPVWSNDSVWSDDLDMLVVNMEETHPFPYTWITREAWLAQVAQVRQRLNYLEPHQIVLEFARLVALIKDGHSRLSLPQDPSLAFRAGHSETPLPRDKRLVFHHLPLQLHWFSDGLYIVACGAGYADLLGARIEKIGGVVVNEAMARIKPFTHRDNEGGFRLLAPAYAMIPELLHHTGLATDLKGVNLKLTQLDGTQISRFIPAINPFETITWQAYKVASSPRLRFPADGEKFALREMPEQKMIYVQFNEANNQKKETLAAFAERLFGLIEAKKYEKLVLDMRRNFGGDHTLTQPILVRIMGSKRINRPGGLFVLIGPGTFSAAVLFASELEQMTHAVFLGEPTGSPANAFGDSQKTQLLASGLTMRISSLYWQQGKPYDHRPGIHPHISVPLTWRDYAAGRDRTMDAVLTYQVGASFKDRLLAVFNEQGCESAMRFHREFLSEPSHQSFQTQNLLHSAIKYLLSKGMLDDAVQVGRECVRAYPDGAEGYLWLGRVLMASGDEANAANALATALKLRPGHGPSRALWQRIKSQAEGLISKQ